jgi:aminoglycoside 3-N-acetyltransferase I
MTRYLTRQVTSRDLSVFKQLLQVFGDAFNEPGTYQGAIPSDEYLTAWLDKPHVIALVAQDGDGGEVVGGLVAYVLDKFEQDRREIYIYDLAVAVPHRRNGIATQLIELLKRVSKEKQAYVIFVQADVGDEPAIRLYESLGTREDVHHFDIEID